MGDQNDVLRHIFFVGQAGPGGGGWGNGSRRMGRKGEVGRRGIKGRDLENEKKDGLDG